jgi:hypothetical protein
MNAPLLFSGCLVACLITSTMQAAPSLVPNGGFEEGTAHWRQLWTRIPGAGTAALDREVVHSGQQSLHIEHHGEQDWSLEPAGRLPVRAGDLFEMEVWLKVQGSGSATLGAATFNEKGQALQWDFGGRTVRARPDWYRVSTRFVVPAAAVVIQPRLIGSGPATLWVDDFAVVRRTNVTETRRPNLPAEMVVSNALLTVTVSTSDGTFSVRDSRTSQLWTQPATPAEVAVTDASMANGSVDLHLLHLASATELTAKLTLAEKLPEFTLELNGTNELASALRYPAPFTSDPGQYLVIPMNEGISYPVEDTSIEPMHLIAYGGHGICMAFWGLTDGARGQMAIIETPDDAGIRLDRLNRRLSVGPEWEAQKGQFGYARRLRYIFFDHGGHVAMCKRYRAYAQEIGLFKTLAEKRQSNSNVDLLIGAANIWCWDPDALPLVKEMQALGMSRLLWSDRQPASTLRTMNDLGVLTSRYDIYQDLMDPANFPNLRGVHPDWTTEGWPKDVMMSRDGTWTRGWEVKGKDDQWYACGVLCDRVAPDYARKRIAAELTGSPYRCRFIDTTTASPWRECYAPDHPLSRSESRRWKMELLRCVSQDFNLVTGCETGHDASVPYVHYFEGMLSLGPYRVPDAGRDMQRILTEVPERVAKFQLGEKYRLPLWELVFHDCVVAQWYWGDYNNKLLPLWPKRDLFNLLYGTPPMFMFSRQFWNEHKQEFARSYQTICPTVRQVGYAEMLNHEFLTQDREVQRTTFANGVTITVNFGATPFSLTDGAIVPPMRSLVK